MAEDRRTERDTAGGADEHAEDETHFDDETGEAEPTSRTFTAHEVQVLLDEQRDKYLRLAAEYDNFRKRIQRERQEAEPRAQAELAKQLLDALDDLDRVSQIDPASSDVASVVQGVELVEKKFLTALQRAGLEQIDPEDEPFDPEQHEAVMTEPALSAEDDNMVARVFQLGYTFKGQMLRPARVVVKQWNG